MKKNKANFSQATQLSQLKRLLLFVMVISVMVYSPMVKAVQESQQNYCLDDAGEDSKEEKDHYTSEHNKCNQNAEKQQELANIVEYEIIEEDEEDFSVVASDDMIYWQGQENLRRQLRDCTVYGFSANIIPRNFIYNRDDPQVETLKYNFKQTPNCDFKTTYELEYQEGIEQFITHNVDDHSFTVYTNDPGASGKYQIKIFGTIMLPSGRNKYTPLTTQTVGYITINNPCSRNYFKNWPLKDQTVNANQIVAPITIPPIQDLKSLENGNMSGYDYCGPRVYTASSSNYFPDFMSIEGDQFIFDQIPAEAVGIYEVGLYVHLFYKDSVKRSDKFKLFVNPCDPSNFVITGPSDQEYTITDPQMSLGFLSNDQQGCVYSIEYELVERSKSFVTIDPDTSEIFVQSDSIVDSGVHQIAIKGTISAPLDYKLLLEDYILHEKIHTFTLTMVSLIDPCDTTVLDPLTISDMKVTVKGNLAAEQTILEIQDSASREGGDMSGLTYCGPRFYTIMAPRIDIVSFQPEERLIRIQATESDQVGSYTMAVKVQLQHYQSISTESQFQVIINPCQVENYEATMIQSELIYKRGGPAFTGFAYSLTQTPDCGYVNTITVQKPESQKKSFLKHNKVAQDFTVVTEDISQIGTHTVTVISSIEIPNDFSQTTFSTQNSEMSFTVDVLDPCEDSELIDFLIEDMSAETLSEIVSQDLPTIIDRVSQQYAYYYGDDGIPFCGKPSFQIVRSNYPLVTMEKGKSQIVFNSKEAAYDSEYQIEIQVELKDYPQAGSSTKTFYVLVGSCQLDQIIPPTSIDSFEYFLRTGEAQIEQILSFTQEPPCNYVLGYDFQLSDGRPLPQWIQVDQTNNILVIKSDDIALMDQRFQVNVNARTTQNFLFQKQEAKFQITIDVKFDCAQDQITSLNMIEDLRIDLQQQSDAKTPSTMTTISPQYTQVLDTCPRAFILEQLLDNQNWIILEEYSPISIIDENTGQIQIEPAHNQKDEVKRLRFTVLNSALTQSLQQEFELTYFGQAVVEEKPITIIIEEEPIEIEPKAEQEEVIPPVVEPIVEEIPDPIVEVKEEKLQPPIVIVPYFVEPEFELNLLDLDLAVKVGGSATQKLNFTTKYGPNVNFSEREPFRMNITQQKNRIQQQIQSSLKRLNVTYDSETGILKIDAKKLSNQDAGFHYVKVEVLFFNTTYQHVYNETLRIYINENIMNTQQAAQEVQEKQSEKLEQNIIYLPDWEGLVQTIDTSFSDDEEDTEEFSRDQPVPYIQSLTQTGIVTVKWDRVMKDIVFVTQDELPDATVLIRNNQNVLRNLRLDDQVEKVADESNEYLLAESYYQTEFYEKVQIKKALEIQLLSGDGQTTDDDRQQILDWKVLYLDDESLQIQVLFKEEDFAADSPLSLLSTLRIRFWGNKLFQSQKDGEMVRYGTTLYCPIFNFIDQDQEQQVEVFREIVKTAFIVMIVMSVPFLALGTTLPLWIFINTVQVLAHLPLMNVKLPAVVHANLLNVLAFVKLDWLVSIVVGENLEDQDQQQQIISPSQHTQSIFDQIRIYGGYTDQYALVITTAVLIFVLASFLQILIGKLFCRNNCCLKNPVQLSNIALRCFCVLFIEICMSITVNLIKVTKNLYGEEQNDSSSNILVLSSTIVVLCATLSLLGFLLLQCCRGSNKIQVDNLYEKGTILMSIFAMRPLQNRQAVIKMIREDKELLALAKVSNMMRIDADRIVPLKKKFTTLASARRLLTTTNMMQTSPDISCEFDEESYMSSSSSYYVEAANAAKEAPSMIEPMIENIVDQPKETHVSVIYYEDGDLVEPIEIIENGEEYPEDENYGRLSQITFSQQIDRNSNTQNNKFSSIEGSSANALSKMLSKNFFEASSTGEYASLAKGSRPRSINMIDNMSQQNSIQVEIQEEEKGGNDQSDVIAERTISAHERKLSITSRQSDEKFEGGQIEQNEKSSPETDKNVNNTDNLQTLDTQTFGEAQIGLNRAKVLKLDSSIKGDLIRITTDLQLAQADEFSSPQTPDCEIILDPQILAKIQIKLEGRLKISQRYNTLFYGLKLSHQRSVALAFPIMFFLRRIIFVASIYVFLDVYTEPFFALIMLIWLTLAMLAYGLHEKQWCSHQINMQYVGNEILLYAIAVVIMVGQGNLASLESHSGLVLECLISIFFLFNTAFIAYIGAKAAILYIKKLYVKIPSYRHRTSKVYISDEKDINLIVSQSQDEIAISPVLIDEESHPSSILIVKENSNDPMGIYTESCQPQDILRKSCSEMEIPEQERRQLKCSVVSDYANQFEKNPLYNSTIQLRDPLSTNQATSQLVSENRIGLVGSGLNLDIQEAILELKIEPDDDEYMDQSLKGDLVDEDLNIPTHFDKITEEQEVSVDQKASDSSQKDENKKFDQCQEEERSAIEEDSSALGDDDFNVDQVIDNTKTGKSAAKKARKLKKKKQRSKSICSKLIQDKENTAEKKEKYVKAENWQESLREDLYQFDEPKKSKTVVKRSKTKTNKRTKSTKPQRILLQNERESIDTVTELSPSPVRRGTTVINYLNKTPDLKYKGILRTRMSNLDNAGDASSTHIYLPTNPDDSSLLKENEQFVNLTRLSRMAQGLRTHKHKISQSAEKVANFGIFDRNQMIARVGNARLSPTKEKVLSPIATSRNHQTRFNPSQQSPMKSVLSNESRQSRRTGLADNGAKMLFNGHSMSPQKFNANLYFQGSISPPARQSDAFSPHARKSMSLFPEQILSDDKSQNAIERKPVQRILGEKINIIQIDKQ